MGLYDRDYMYGDRGNGNSATNILWALIAVNAAMFLIAPRNSYLHNIFALHCIAKDFHVFQLLTAEFLHYDLMHIIFNMYGLYIFGKLVTPHLGNWRFLVLYLSGGLFGNLLFVAMNLNSSIALVGASGAVCAVMMAAAMLEPDRRFVMLFLPFSPIKTSTLIICYTILEVIMAFSSANSSVAHLAHLGGFVGGYLAVKLMRRGNVAWDPFRRKHKNIWRQSAAGSSSAPEFHAPGSPVSRDELDALLDKISRYGINSLSPEELARLKQAREEMRR